MAQPHSASGSEEAKPLVSVWGPPRNTFEGGWEKNPSGLMRDGVCSPDKSGLPGV